MNKRIVALILSLCITINMSGCRNKNIKDFTSTDTTKDASSIELEEVIFDYLKLVNDTEIAFSKDIILSEEEENLLLNECLDTNVCNDIYLGDYTNMYNDIIKNTNEYLSVHVENYSPFSDNLYLDNYTNKYNISFGMESMQQIKSYVTDSIYNEICYIMSTSKSLDDIHKLSKLRIVYADGIEDNVLARYIDDTIIIYLDNIMDSSTDMFIILTRVNQTIKHEFNHVRQENCEDKIENGSKNEIDILSDREDTFLMEASSESEIYNLYRESVYMPNEREFNYNYISERAMESNLFLMTLLDNNKPMDNYYSAIYNGSLNDLVSFLGGSTLQDKLDILKIIYGIDAMCLNNSYLTRVFSIDKLSSLDTKDIFDYFKYSYNNAIFKRVIKHFIEYNNTNNNLSIEDNYILFSLVETTLVSNSYFYRNDTKIYYQEYFDDYNKLKDIYLEYLASKYNIDINTVYEDYTNSCKDKWLYYFRDIVYNDGIYSLGSIDDDYDKVFSLVERFPKIRSIIMANPYMIYNDVTNMNLELLKKH